MRISAFSVLALGVGFSLVGIQLTACSNSADDCNATATCGSTSSMPHAGNAGKSGGGSDTGGDGVGGKVSGGGSSSNGGSSGGEGVGGEGGGGNGNGNGACMGDVSEDAACWTTNELGVFVSSDSGDDAAGDGTKEAPFKSITKGIAAAAGKNVYVCVGATDYAEKITLDAASDGIHIYGGFECTNWMYATTRSAQVLSPSNIALRIDGLKKGAQIENVAFKAADATGTGADASSYGAFVTASKGVKLTRVEIVAGKGAKGADGEAGATGANATAPGADQNGKAPQCSAAPASADGGLWDAAVCGSRGGDGGKAVANTPGGNGFSGTPGQNVTPPNKVNLGEGKTGNNVQGVDGSVGADGNAPALAPAAAPAGTFAAVGFAPAGGKDGDAGFPGQGGGGGGASGGNTDAGTTCRGASGGAGGMGGCGGGGGKAGGGGGASVGLFAWSSQVALVSCSVRSVAGGAGGKGGASGVPGSGGEGGVGGSADLANEVGKGGHGGPGGNGGPGANGSGGTGGPSYAVVYSSGMQPTYDAAETTLTAGTPGAFGSGGQRGSTTKAPDGSDGASGKEFEVL